MNQNYSEVRSAVLLNTFLIDKKRYRVFYNNGLLIWEKEKSKKSKQNNFKVLTKCVHFQFKVELSFE